MFKGIRNIKNRFDAFKNSLTVEGFLLTVFLSIITLVLSANILRVVLNGKSNYETYQNEKESLAEIEAKNRELLRESEFVSSDEYKRLVLRESSNLATDAEQLFDVKDKPVYYQEEKEYLDISAKKDFLSWWMKLVY